MRDKIKPLIIINIFSVIMFILCLILAFTSDNLILKIGVSLLWFFYTAFGNLYGAKYMLYHSKPKSLRDTFHTTNKQGIFNREVLILQNQYDSIKSRENFMLNSTDSMQELYYKILNQAESNLESASAYMGSYDYYTKPEPTYIRNLCRDGNELVQKFNNLVEKLVDIDTNPTTLDVKYVDDLTESLEQMKEYQQVMM